MGWVYKFSNEIYERSNAFMGAINGGLLIGLLITSCRNIDQVPVPFRGKNLSSNSSWEIIPELTDEFEGKRLNSKKWFDYDPKWLGRKPAYFVRENISVVDGELHLLSRLGDAQDKLPKGYRYSTAAVKSKAAVKYGYFEVMCKPINSAITSAFWFYKANSEAHTEIDVFEGGVGEPGKQNDLLMAAHVFKSPDLDEYDAWGKTWKAPYHYNLADEYHIYALDWNKDRITWLVDNKVVYSQKNVHLHYPLNMMFSSETMESRALPLPGSLPGTFKIKYVRSWRKVEK